MSSLEKFTNWPTLAFLSALVLFSGLGSYGLLETSEARYAEISWEMARSGDWTTPRYNFIKHFHKPPITYWSTAAAMKIFGKTEFAARFAPALFGFGGILVTFFIGRTIFDRLTGFLAGIVLLSCLEYFFISRYLVTDMLLTFFTTLSLLFYCKGLSKSSNWWFFFISLSGAMLTKGPVGILLVMLIIGLHLLLSGKGREFLRMGWGKGLLVVLLLSSPWFILLFFKNPGLFEYLVFNQLVDRFFTQTHGRPGNFFYFVPVFLVGLLPWTILLPNLLKKYFTLKRDAEKGNTCFLTLWLFAPLVFFSFSGSKLVGYILPVYPAASLLMGKMWRDALKNPATKEIFFRISLYVYYIGFTLLAVAFIVFLFQVEKFSDLAQFDLTPMKNTAFLLSFFSIAGILVTAHALKSDSIKIFFPTLALGSILGCLVLIYSVSSIEPLLSPTTHFAKKISEKIKPGDRIINYKCLLNGLPFYLDQRVITVHIQRETQFETDQEEVKRYVIGHKQGLKKLVESEGGFFLVMRKRHFKQAMAIAERPLNFLAETPSHLLITNKEMGKK